MGELIFNGAMLVFFIAMLIYSSQIAIWQGHIWARYWPMTLLVIAVILFGIKVVGIYKELPKEQRKFSWEIFGLKNKNVRLLLLSFAWLLVYVAVLPKLGFVLTTLLFCIGMEMLLGAKFSLKTLLGAFAITITIYAIFTWGLGISVPRGVGRLYDFGKWLEYLWS
jgi:hypothetical protein